MPLKKSRPAKSTRRAKVRILAVRSRPSSHYSLLTQLAGLLDPPGTHCAHAHDELPSRFPRVVRRPRRRYVKKSTPLTVEESLKRLARNYVADGVPPEPEASLRPCEQPKRGSLRSPPTSYQSTHGWCPQVALATFAKTLQDMDKKRAIRTGFVLQLQEHGHREAKQPKSTDIPSDCCHVLRPKHPRVGGPRRETI